VWDEVLSTTDMSKLSGHSISAITRRIRAGKIGEAILQPMVETHEVMPGEFLATGEITLKYGTPTCHAVEPHQERT
jgi:ATP-dependent RNA circularization protein (DNA/RNA ligase family)